MDTSLRRASFRIALLAALTHLAPAGADPLVQENCARQARLTQEINVGTGVNNEQVTAASPLRITLPTGFDDAAYGECLRREGFDRREKVAASFDRARECSAQARQAARVRIAAAGRRIAGGFDERAYRRCLDGEVTAEVIETGR